MDSYATEENMIEITAIMSFTSTCYIYIYQIFKVMISIH